MKKIIIGLLSVFIIQNVAFSKEVIQFDFPNAGWHQVVSPDGNLNKKCFVPVNQTSDNYTEMLVFNKKIFIWDYC